MHIRPAFRAGSFYEADPLACRRHVELLIASADLPDDLPARLFGGLVPHAGWVYSGRLAAITFKALLAGGNVETVVLLGADHTGAAQIGEVWPSGVWETPLGKAAVDEELAAELLAGCDLPPSRAGPGLSVRRLCDRTETCSHHGAVLYCDPSSHLCRSDITGSRPTHPGDRQQRVEDQGVPEICHILSWPENRTRTPAGPRRARRAAHTVGRDT